MGSRERIAQRLVARRPLYEFAVLEEVRPDGMCVMRASGRPEPFLATPGGRGNPSDFVGQTIQILYPSRSKHKATAIFRDESIKTGDSPFPSGDQFAEYLCSAWLRLRGGSAYYIGDDRPCNDSQFSNCSTYDFTLADILETVSTGSGIQLLRGYGPYLYRASGNSVIQENLSTTDTVSMACESEPLAITVGLKTSSVMVVTTGTNDSSCPSIPQSCAERAATGIEDGTAAGAEDGFLDGLDAEGVDGGTGSRYDPICPISVTTDEDQCYCDAYTSAYSEAYATAYNGAIEGWNDAVSQAEDSDYFAGIDDCFLSNDKYTSFDETYGGECGDGPFNDGACIDGDPDMAYSCAFCYKYKQLGYGQEQYDLGWSDQGCF